MGHPTPKQQVCEGACGAEISQAANRLRLLVAEDNAMIAQVTLAQLTRRGHHVTLAVNGDEAVLACAEQQFDAVLMDCQMPCLDGFGATRVIRAMDGYADVPIIALTTETFDGVRQQCRDAGMSGYLFKPATPCQLRVCLEHHTRLADAMFSNYDTSRGEIFSVVSR